MHQSINAVDDFLLPVAPITSSELRALGVFLLMVLSASESTQHSMGLCCFACGCEYKALCVCI